MNNPTIKKFTIGDLLFRVRARMDITQLEMVSFLGLNITRGAISKYEFGEIRPSRRRMLVIVEKITPHLRPEELAALEEMT